MRFFVLECGCVNKDDIEILSTETQRQLKCRVTKRNEETSAVEGRIPLF